MQDSKFVVLTTQRTGSTWLMDRLNQIPGVEGHVELFLPYPRRSPAMAGFNEVERFCEYPRRGAMPRPLVTWTYLNELYCRDGSVGFKLMYSHLRQHMEILPYIAMRRVAVVHLVRDNSLDIVISEALAAKLGSSHAVNGSSSQPADTRVRLDPKATWQRIEQIEANKRRAQRIISFLPMPSYEIRYEDLHSDRDAFSNLYSFLGLTPNDNATVSKLKKRQTLPRQDAIENFDEIHTMLASKRLERLALD